MKGCEMIAEEMKSDISGLVPASELEDFFEDCAFVDFSAGTNGDGTVERPFNNFADAYATGKPIRVRSIGG